MLCKLTGIPYSVGMSNIAHITGGNSVREARGAFVRDALRSERWSIRQAALAIGMSNTALSDRCRGIAPFLADDIEAIAELLHRDPVAFYGEYLAANENDPRPGGGQGGAGGAQTTD